MNPENQGNGPDSSSNIFFKRKRGRPRKDQSQNLGRTATVSAIRDFIQGHAQHAHVPPGFERTNGSHPQQGNDAMVGQTVTGVIESTFDAGYLLSVKVGNSDTSLRGVVFKPGHYVPVSTENDVAPHIQMVIRNEVLFPAGYHTPVHGSYRRGRGRGRARSESRLAYSANGSAGNQLQVVPAQPSPLVGNRGTVVPVVLQPANPLTSVAPAIETSPAASQPAHLAASKAKQMNQTEVTQMETDNGSSSAKHVQDGEGSAVKLPAGVMEESVDEVKGTEGSSQSKETENDSAKPSGTFTPEQMQDLSQPLLVKPLQAIWSDSLSQNPSVPQNLRDARAGKMTELLLAVQENLIDKQGADAQHHDFSQQQN